MTIQDRIARRKIGAFELLVGAFPVEFVFGSTSRAILLLTLSVGFYFAKKQFKGEFALLDLVGLFQEERK
jgi:hypothetical protein